MQRAQRNLTSKEREQFSAEGVAHLPECVSADWLKQLKTLVAQREACPSPRGRRQQSRGKN
ncbi:MAG: hypothetical protein AAF493_25640 [Pseudomonadota bacterium]